MGTFIETQRRSVPFRLSLQFLFICGSIDRQMNDIPKSSTDQRLAHLVEMCVHACAGSAH